MKLACRVNGIVSYAPADILGLKDSYGIKPGARADLLIADAVDAADLVDGAHQSGRNGRRPDRGRSDIGRIPTRKPALNKKAPARSAGALSFRTAGTCGGLTRRPPPPDMSHFSS